MTETNDGRQRRRRHQASDQATIRLSEWTERYIEEQLATARAEIIWRLAERAALDAEAAQPPTPTNETGLSFGADELTEVLKEIELGGPKDKPTRAATFFSWFPPFTCVCAVLCLVFAILGLLGGSNRAGVTANQASGFLDVAKIFAGAIVGSTTTTAVAQIKKRRGS